MSPTQTPLGAVVRGAAAGVIGTGVMTAAQTAYLRATGGEPSSTPAEVGKRVIEGVLRREVPESWLGQLNTAVHLLYGTSWGPVYGVIAGTRGRGGIGSGLAFGAVVWGASLVQLPAMGLAPPVWEYTRSDLAPDVGFHLAYGAAVGLAFRMLARSPRRR